MMVALMLFCLLWAMLALGAHDARNFSLDGGPHLRSHVKRHLQFRNHPASKLLVVVIAAGDLPRRDTERGFWRLIAREVEPFGVTVYLVGQSPTVTQITPGPRQILLPGMPTLDNILDATYESLNFIFTHQMLGHDAPFVLRANLSSFWIFSRVLEWLKGRPTANWVGGWPLLNDYAWVWPQGAGYFMSRDVAVKLADTGHAGKLLVDPSLADDVRVGYFFSVNLNITMDADMLNYHTNLQENVTTTIPDLQIYNHSFAYRVRNDETTGFADIALYSMLYFEYYGPGAKLESARPWIKY